MKLMHDMQTYPPRVKMTVVILEAGNHVKIPIKFDGCLDGDPLSLDLIFPLGTYHSRICIIMKSSCQFLLIFQPVMLCTAPHPPLPRHLYLVCHTCLIPLLLVS